MSRFVLPGGGETGVLVRSYDWTSTPLGPIETWPQSLITTVRTVLLSPAPIVLLWGEDGVMIYNDAYAIIAGSRHPQLLGSKVREGWPEIAAFNDNVMRVGLSGGTLAYRDQELTLYRHGRPEQVWMNLDYSPVLGDNGRPAGVLAIVVETTERVRSERRENFRLALKARLRELSEPSAVMDTAVEALGTYLGAHRVGYTEIHEDAGTATVLSCYADGVAPISGTHNLNAFGSDSNARQRQGLVEVCADILADPMQEHATWAAIDTRAFVSVPLVRNSRFTASLFVNFREPHAWAEEEVALIEDVAARTWEAVQRARAEATASRAQIEQAGTASALNALLSNAPIGFAFFDREHRYTRVNDLLAEINGLPAEAHLGRSIEELLPVNARAVGPILDRVFETGEPIGSIEVDGETPASPGESRSWLTGFFPVFRHDGAIVQVGATVVDITDRKRAEEQLRESEERLRLATEHAEVGFWDVDEVNQQLHWPPIVKAMFGISPDVPVSMLDFYEGLHPDDRDQTSTAYAAAADPAHRALYDVEYRTIGKEDGVLRWVAAKGRGTFAADGRCVRVIGTAIDITARKATEERLRDLNETLERRVAEALAERKLFADLVEGTDAFVQVVDLEFRWLAINKAASREFKRIFGVRPQVGQSMLDVLAHLPEHRSAVEAVWSRALAGEEFAEVGEFGDPARDRRHYEMKYNVLRGPDGRQIGAYQFVYDVTDRMAEQRRLAEAEEALRQAQKMEAVGQLTGGLAHDFNNLLTGILGSLELLQTRVSQGRLNEIDRYITAAQGASKRAAALTHRLLAFSRRQTLDPKPTNVNRLVAGMEELIRRTVGPEIDIEVVGAGGLWVALVDANQLENALLNLCINSRDAMPEGGRITIETGNRWLDGHAAKERDLPPGQYLSLCVTDTGTGMPPDVIARAFDPFFTTKPQGQGTGLGLSMIYGFVRQSGGQVRIYSEVGHGTTVCLYLPRYDGDAEGEVALVSGR